MVEPANFEIWQSVNHNKVIYDSQAENSLNVSPYTLFLHAMKSSPVTMKKYSRCLEMFF